MKQFFSKGDLNEITSRLSSIASMLSGKTLLITGGRGFLGRYFIEIIIRLNKSELKEPCRIIIIDNLITSGAFGKEVVKNKNIKFIEHNVVKEILLEEKIDFIIHAAGIASPYYYRAYPMQTLEVATIGTKYMLELARRNNAKFVFFSSSEIYGDPDPKYVPMKESYRGNVSVAGPRACYDESKRLGETLCYIYHNQFDVHTNTIRPFNIFGPGMQENDYRALPNFASSIKANKPISIYGKGTQTRTFCYITDAMVGFFLTLIKGLPGEAYNIGNPKPEISMIDLISKISKMVKNKVEYSLINYPDSYPADEPMRRCPDIQKAKSHLNYKPEIDLDIGLQRFFDWTDHNYKGEK